MLQLLEEGRRIVNVDESWLNETSFYRKLWHPKNQVCSVPTQPVSPRLSLIAAIDTEGRIWYSLTQANTDSDVMLLFFTNLLRILDQETPMWREDVVFLLDGARYHTSPETKEHLRLLGLKVIYTAPYSYASSPIEKLFGALKLGELNPNREPAGKK